MPRGATVLATPAVIAPALPNGNITLKLQQEGLANPPGAESKEKRDDEEEDKKDAPMNDVEFKPRQPSVMVWNAFFPGGKEFPLRQPQPPVYFQMPPEQQQQPEQIAS